MSQTKHLFHIVKRKNVCFVHGFNAQKIYIFTSLDKINAIFMTKILCTGYSKSFEIYLIALSSNTFERHAMHHSKELSFVLKNDANVFLVYCFV